MEVLKVSEIAKALNGRFNKDAEISSVVIDTRKITKGALFVCIKGERFDAHQFVDEAFKLGAAAVMVHKDVNTDKPCLKVDNTTSAFLRLAGFYRNKFDIPVVGLTGSVGKTTTKDFIHLALSAKYNAIKTEGNLNNEIGVPQMLLKFDKSVEAAVIEMGMNHFGEISKLTNAVKPSLAVITNIGVSHIENLGSREGILKSKLEILEGMDKTAPLIINSDNDMLATISGIENPIVRFGIESGDYKAENICEENGKTKFNFVYSENRKEVEIPTVGVHNVYNALAALTVADTLNIDIDKAIDKLKEYVPSGMRQKMTNVAGITSIEDCYNASPDSMKAAISTLANTKSDKKFAVLADMLELGDYSETAHRNVGKMVAEGNIDYLLAFGENAKYYVEESMKNGTENAILFDTKEKLADYLAKNAKSGDAVLFKGSRGMKLEEVINAVYDRWEKK